MQVTRTGSSLSTFLITFSFLTLTSWAASSTIRPATAQERYVWPLTGHSALTSTFGEYRTGHFHAGIDISTGGRTGAPVRAIASGYVARVRVSPFGYGKAIYIKQHDGRYAVYAHLKGFTTEINTLVKERQLATGQYEAEIYPGAGRYPAQQGEIIGFSGRSGCAAPHLHFGLRDASNRPINPLTHGLSVSDRVAPRFVSLCLYPIGDEASIDGEQRPCTISLNASHKRNAYRTEKKVRVNGTFALSAYLYDEQNRRSYPLGPYRLETFLDGALLFRTQMKQFSYPRTHDADVAFDYRLAALNVGKFLRQFAFAGNQLEIHALENHNAGIVDASEWRTSTGSGAHTIKLIASDAGGNSSEALLEAFRDDEPVVEKAVARLEGDTLHLEADAHDPDGNVTVVYFTIWGQGQKIIAKTRSAAAETGKFTGSLQLSRSATSQDVMVEATAEDDAGVKSKPLFVPANVGAGTGSEPARLDLAGEWHENSLFLTVNSDRFLKVPPLMSIIWDDSSPIRMKATMETPYTASCMYRPETGKSGTLRVSVTAYDLREKAADATWLTAVTTIWRETGGTAEHARTVRVEFPANGVYRPIFVRIEPLGDQVHAEIPFITRPYRIEPTDEPLDGKATLTFSLRDADTLRGAGIYGLDPKGEWNYVSTGIDQAGKRLTASIRRLGTYAVLQDTVAPRIWAVRPRNGSTVRNSKPRISAHVDDTGSGIDYKAITVHLDDELIICEYDPYEETISHQLDGPLAQGKHVLSISLSDYAGNTSSATTSFIAP